MSHAKEEPPLLFGASDRIELIATITMALAAILTAWCAFQATKWGGIMSIEFSSANATRIESAKAEGLANTQRSVDVNVYTQWLEAVAGEIAEGVIPPVREAGYEPQEGTLSAFYFERMRPEFKTALDAWLETDPLNDPAAPPTPFAMESTDSRRASRQKTWSVGPRHTARPRSTPTRTATTTCSQSSVSRWSSSSPVSARS